MTEQDFEENQIPEEEQEDNSVPEEVLKIFPYFPFITNVSRLTRGSGKRVRVICQAKFSDKCRNAVTIQYCNAVKVMSHHGDKFICVSCSCAIRASGRIHGNCIYKSLDENYFSSVDTEAKGYLLGWIASDGHVDKKGRISIAIHQKDEEILRNLRDSICPDIPIGRSNRNPVTPTASLSFYSKKMAKDICSYLGVSPGRKTENVDFPQGLPDNISWAVLRGIFDGDGYVRKLRGVEVPRRSCMIASISSRMKESISKFVGDMQHYIDPKAIRFTGEGSLQFLHKIYSTSSPNLRLERKYNEYLEYLDYAPGIDGHNGKFPNGKYVKTRIDAISPYKENISDEGYCIALLEERGVISNTITSYDTGIKVQLEEGWYIELFAPQSLIDSGYSLEENRYLRDESYRRTLRVNLVKTNPEAPPLKLPFIGIQIALRQV